MLVLVQWYHSIRLSVKIKAVSVNRIFFDEIRRTDPYDSQENMIAVPRTAMIAPMISLRFTFSLNSSTAKGMIRTGTIEMIVLAMPVEVFWTATSDR